MTDCIGERWWYSAIDSRPYIIQDKTCLPSDAEPVIVIREADLKKWIKSHAVATCVSLVSIIVKFIPEDTKGGE